MAKAVKRKPTTFDELVTSVKRYRIVTIILFVLFVGQNIFSLLELPSKFIGLGDLYLSETSKRYKENEAKIKQLRNGIPMSFVESLFGKAKYIRELNQNCGPQGHYTYKCDNQFMVNEYMYENSDFILDFVTDADDIVVMFSITTLKKDFNPEVSVFFNRFTELNKVKLGITKFAELPLPNTDFFLQVEREGLMSGNGGNGGFNKIYISDDYASNDNYVFQISFAARATTSFINDECPIMNLADNSWYDGERQEFNKERMEQLLDEFEKLCVISTVKSVSQIYHNEGEANGPEYYSDYVEIW